MNEFTVNKCNHQGERVFQYQGYVVERGPNFVTIRAPFTGSRRDLGVVVFEQGDIFTEWHYNDRWYNVFRVQEPVNEQIKGWYCNITRPAEIGEDSVCSDDLVLDVFVTPNGSIMLLDEEDFKTLDVGMEERLAALRAVEAIRQAVAECEGPFEQLRNIR